MEKTAVSVAADAETERKQTHNMRFSFNRVDTCATNSPIEGGENYIGACDQGIFNKVGSKQNHFQEAPVCCGSTTKDIPALPAGKNMENMIPQHFPMNEDHDNDLVNVQVLQKKYSSLNHLLVYESDQSDEYDENMTVVFNNSNQVNVAEPRIDDDEEDDNNTKSEEFNEAVEQLGDLSIDDLPPVVVPKTEVRAEECELVGYVSSIVNKLSTYLEIMVKALPNKPVFDIDTLLFIENGKQPLGYIFDVIGQVTRPQYVIRFNSLEEIEDLYAEVGSPVYSAPRTEHSHYVFMPQLLKQKGSDASWKHDCEVPQEYVDYSGDEDESGRAAAADSQIGQARHKKFEKNMNLRNLIYSQLHSTPDFIGPVDPRVKQEASKTSSPKQQQQQQQQHRRQQQQQSHSLEANYTNSTACAFPPSYRMPQPQYRPQMLPYVPQFMPNVPPPGFHFAGGPSAHMHPANLQYNLVPPHGVRSNVDMFRNMPPMLPPNAPPQSCMSAPHAGPIMYPAEMGLPPPPPPRQQNFVPNMSYFNGPPVMWNNYPAQSAAQASTGDNQAPTVEQMPVSDIGSSPLFYLPPN